MNTTSSLPWSLSISLMDFIVRSCLFFFKAQFCHPSTRYPTGLNEITCEIHLGREGQHQLSLLWAPFWGTKWDVNGTQALCCSSEQGKYLIWVMVAGSGLLIDSRNCGFAVKHSNDIQHNITLKKLAVNINGCFIKRVYVCSSILNCNSQWLLQGTVHSSNKAINWEMPLFYFSCLQKWLVNPIRNDTCIWWHSLSN